MQIDTGTFVAESLCHHYMFKLMQCLIDLHPNISKQIDIYPKTLILYRNVTPNK